MVVVMQEGATEEQIQNVIDRLVQMGFDVHRSTGAAHTVLGAVGGAPVDHRDIELLEGVREVVKISASYKLASRAFKPDGTVVKVGPPGRQIEIGGRNVVMMAGPCTVESAEQIDTIAGIMSDCGIRILRGGAFKPRTSPYSFQGMGEEGLKVLRAGRRQARSARDFRNHEPDADPDVSGSCRYSSGRRAQHAELRSAEGAGESAESRSC